MEARNNRFIHFGKAPLAVLLTLLLMGTACEGFGTALTRTSSSSPATATATTLLEHCKSSREKSSLRMSLEKDIVEIDYTSITREDWVSSLPPVSRERYQREAQISHAFTERDFRPSGWAANNHFQTIAGSLFRKEAMYSRGARDMGVFLDVLGVGKSPSSGPLEEFAWDERFRVDTDDGDFFDVDWRYAQKGSDVNKDEDDTPVCLICHGLESCSDSDDVRELAIACHEIGMDAACLNFRGCSDSGENCNMTPRAYHLGFTDDLLQYVREVRAKSPNKRIYLSGFSLGAGVVTKLLAELGPKAYNYNICGAATNAVPFDTTQNHKQLNEPGFTQKVYGDRLLASMKTRMTKNYDQFGFDFDPSEIEKCQTIMDVENLMICSTFGFDDAFDYYDKVKTIDKLHRICVPQYVLHAKDDPFFVGLERVTNDPSLPLRTHYTEHGGHCGFIFHQRNALENREASKTSWMPTQLARFLEHVEANHATKSSSAGCEEGIP